MRHYNLSTAYWGHIWTAHWLYCLASITSTRFFRTSPNIRPWRQCLIVSHHTRRPLPNV